MAGNDPLASMAARCARYLVPGALAVYVLAPSAFAQATVPDGFEVELYADNADLPVGMAFLPDGRMLIVEKVPGAHVHLIVDGAVLEPPLLTIQNVATGNTRGLLSVAVDPQWPLRPYAYFYFTHTDRHCYLRMYTASGELSNPSSTDLTLSDPYEILSDIPENSQMHNGGTLRFDADGMLCVSCGDDNDRCAATDPTSLKGAILRLDVSALPGPGGGPPEKSVITPPDNPFPGPDENERLVFCYGLRNPYHYSIDRLTGRLYIGDVGENLREELDEASGGEYFGWPRFEGTRDTGNGSCPGPAGVQPIWEYSHAGGNSLSIIGGPVYRPAPSGGIYDFPPEYDGDVFFIEHYRSEMVRLKSVSGQWALADPVPGQPSPETWASGFGRVSDLLVGPDGAIYFAKYDSPGRIMRIISTSPGSVEGPGSPAATRIRLTISPNPIRPAGTTSVSYTVPDAGEVTVTVYTVAGERVATLFAGAKAAGRHEHRWDGRLADGSRVAPGLYLVRVQTPGGRARGKLTIF